MRTGQWTCPLCGHSKRLTHTIDYIDRSLKASLLGHIRNSSDDRHGGPHSLPNGFDRDSTPEFITIGAYEDPTESAVAPASD